MAAIRGPPAAQAEPPSPLAPPSGDMAGEGGEASVDFLVAALLESGSVEHVQAMLVELQSCVQSLRPFRGRVVVREALEAAVQVAAARFRAGPPGAGTGGAAEPSLDAVHAQARPGLPPGLPTAVQARLGHEGSAKFEDIAAGRPQAVEAFGKAAEEWASLASNVEATLAAAEAALARSAQFEKTARLVKAAISLLPATATPRLLVLGGLGLSAPAAADTTLLVQSSWLRGLARRALDARSCKAQVVLGGQGSCVPSCEGFDILCIEGLDRASLGTGLWLRTARELLRNTPTEALPSVVPRSAAVFAALVEADGLQDCAGFDLTNMAGYCGLTPASVMLDVELRSDEERPKSGRSFRLLTQPFHACELWSSPQDLAALAPSEERVHPVEVVKTGRCDAVVFFVVQDSDSDDDRAGPRRRVGIQWLGQGSARVEAGGPTSVVVRRNLSRIWFELQASAGEKATAVEAAEPRPSERAFLEQEHLDALADMKRSAAYDGAICRAVKAVGKDARVLDVGSGSGLLMMMANRAGARLVRGVERVVDLAQTSFEVFDANRMDQQDHCDMEVVCSNLLKSQRGPDEAPYDVVVADLMDHSGLGGGIAPLLRHARGHFLKEGGAILPRKLTIFAFLAELGGTGDKASPRAAPWPVSALLLAGWPGTGDAASTVAADLGEDGLQCRPLSGVMEVLTLDFNSAEPLETGTAEVVFRGAAAGTANAVCWFWFAELDAEASLSNAPCGLLGGLLGGEESCVQTAVQCGHTHWKQALQAIGPVAVHQSSEVRVKLEIEETKLSWSIEVPSEDAFELLAGSAPLAASLLAEYRCFASAWATVRRETLVELEQAAWNLLARDPTLRRQQLLAALELLSQACAFRGVVHCPCRAMLPGLFRGACA